MKDKDIILAYRESITLLFTFLKVLGTGFLGLIGAFFFIQVEVGFIVAKMSIYYIGLLMVLTSLIIIKKFVIIDLILKKHTEDNKGN
jgi:hypothetical protein